MNSKITTVIMMMAGRLGTPGARMDIQTVATLRVNLNPSGIRSIGKRRVNQRKQVVVSREAVRDRRIEQGRLELMSNHDPRGRVKVTFNFGFSGSGGIGFSNPSKCLRLRAFFRPLKVDVT